jgi:hypothetical protein
VGLDVVAFRFGTVQPVLKIVLTDEELLVLLSLSNKL